MVFGLSSGETLLITSDHLPSAGVYHRRTNFAGQTF
jgi:uncharacterized protein (DUF2249 family)